jgi:hypothetical protein
MLNNHPPNDQTTNILIWQAQGLHDKNYQIINPIVLHYRQILNNLPPNDQMTKTYLSILKRHAKYLCDLYLEKENS